MRGEVALRLDVFLGRDSPSVRLASLATGRIRCSRRVRFAHRIRGCSSRVPAMHADMLLLGPGPSNPYPEVMEAFQRPVLGHLDPDFLVVLDEIGDRLRAV